MKTKFFLFLVVIQMQYLFLTNKVVFSQWEVMSGISNKTIDFNSIKYFNDGSGTVIAVGDSSVIARTTDSGAKWLCKTLDNNYYTNINCIDLKNNVCVAVGDNGYVFKSTDNGKNWIVGKRAYPYQNLNGVCIASSSLYFACGNNGYFYYSTNAGNNWYGKKTQSSVNFNAIKFIDEKIGYIAGDYGTILRTTNCGKSFEYVTSGTNLGGTISNLNSLDIVSTIKTYQWYAVGDNGKVLTGYYSPKQVESFKYLTGFSGNLKSVDFISETYGWIYSSNGEMYSTTSCGEIWIKEISPSSKINSIVAHVDFLWCAGEDGLICKNIFSEDGKLIQSKHMHSLLSLKKELNPGKNLQRNLVFPQERSGFCQEVWSPQVFYLYETDFLTVDAVSDFVAWAGGLNSAVVRTTDGGETWMSANPNDMIGYDIICMNALNSDTALVGAVNFLNGSDSTFIYKTIDGGQTWTNVYTLSNNYSWVDGIQMIDANNGFALLDPISDMNSNNWLILKTTDGGISWTPIANSPSAGFAEYGYNNSFQILGNNIWFGSNSSKIYRSTNLGQTWTFSTISTHTASLNDVHFNNDTLGIVCGSNLGSSTGLEITTDGGITFTAMNQPAISSNDFFIGVEGHKNNFWVIALKINDFYSTIYKTTNYGATWSAEVGNEYVWDINFIDVEGCPEGWAGGGTPTNSGGTNYDLMTRMNSTVVTGMNETQNKVPQFYKLKQNYPNPFNPATNIQFDIPKDGNVSIKVYDVSGKEITEIVNGFKNAGSYIVGFNASRFASGIYFYRLEINGFVDTKKMILNK